MIADRIHYHLKPYTLEVFNTLDNYTSAFVANAFPNVHYNQVMPNL